MIRMEIEINEEKLQRQRGISAAAVYRKVDALFAKHGLIKKDTGIYVKRGDDNDLSAFMIVMGRLREAKWFYPYVASWWFFVGESEVTNVVAAYERVEKKKAMKVFG